MPRSGPIKRHPDRADKDETATWRVALWSTTTFYLRRAHHPRTARFMSGGWAQIRLDDGCLSSSEESSRALAMFKKYGWASCIMI